MSFLNKDFFVSLSVLSIMYWLGYHVITDTGVGMIESLLFWFGITFLTFGGHELAHYLWAKNVCDKDALFKSIDERPWGIIAVLGIVLLLSGVYGWTPKERTMISLGGMVGILALVHNKLIISAGAVRIDGKMEVFCKTSTALVAPVFNLVVGVLLILSGWDSIWVDYAIIINVWLAFFNSLPHGVLDGGFAWRGDITSKVATLMVVLSSTTVLVYTPL